MSDDNNDNKKNVFTLVPPSAPATEPEAVDDYEPETEVYTYSLQTKDGTEYIRDGFLIFNNSSAVLMREIGPGTAIPILVVPFENLAIAEILDDE